MLRLHGGIYQVNLFLKFFPSTRKESSSEFNNSRTKVNKSNSIRERLMMSRILFKNGQRGVVLLADYGNKNSVFQRVLSVRKRGDAECRELPCDSYSHHFLLVKKSHAVGVISVTAMRDGTIDCEDHYPKPLLDKYGKWLETAYAFHILESGRPAFSSVIRMVRAIWKDRLPQGSRLHLVNATGPLIGRYKAMGYTLIPNATFMHPRLSTLTVPMVLPADPNRRSVCQQLFTDISSPLSLADVAQACTPTEYTSEAV